MKLTSRNRENSKLELQMTSMIDCVFLLLIFFMVTSSFSLAERQLDAAIQVQRVTPSPAQMDFEPAIIDIVQGSSGNFVFKIGGRELPDQKALTDVLMQFESKLDAFVRPDDNAPFDKAAAAIQACKDARFARTIYAPRETRR
jgi:biopolymer transport protein ExbD